MLIIFLESKEPAPKIVGVTINDLYARADVTTNAFGTGPAPIINMLQWISGNVL